MAKDEDARFGGFADQPFVPPGPRRSSYTPPGRAGQQPPEGGARPDEPDPARHDDDELARALAEEVARYADPMRAARSGVSGPDDSRDPEAPQEHAPPESPAPESVVPESVVPAAQPHAGTEPEPGPDAGAAVPVAEQPVAEGLPLRPRRRSLPNDELVQALAREAESASSTAQLMDRLEAQLRLREEEAQEFRVWENAMLAIGTPEALSQVERARLDFTGVIPIITPDQLAGRFPLAHAPAQKPAAAEALPEVRTEPRSEPPLSPPPLVEPLPAPQHREPVWPEPAEQAADAQPAPDAQIELPAPSGPLPWPEAQQPDGQEARQAVVADPLPAEAATALMEPTPAMEPAAEPATGPVTVETGANRGVSLFWLWFAANSSALSIALGATILSFGLSLRQAVIAAVGGVLLSLLPIGAGVLAGKRSDQPTMMVSRAAFGTVGNIVPSILAVVARVFLAALLLWLSAASAAALLTKAGLTGRLDSAQLVVIGLVAGFVIVMAAASSSVAVLLRLQLILTILTGILLIWLIVASWDAVHVSVAVNAGDGPWILVIGGAVLVFIACGLAWATGGGDFVRADGPATRSRGAAGWSMLGTALPLFVLVCYGALLAASNPRISDELATDPVGTLSGFLPGWAAALLIAAISLGLLSGAIVSAHSGVHAVRGIATDLARPWRLLVVGLLLALAAAALLAVLPREGLEGAGPAIRDLAMTAAVPIAAWAGIFAAEQLIRTRRYDTASLLRRGGAYPAANWVNLVMLGVASAVGYGLITASLSWLSWQGFLFPLLGFDAGADFAATDIGVIVALVLGLITPLVAGIPRIRRQERFRSTH